MRQFDLAREPRDAVLHSLLDLSLESCDEFYLALTEMELDLPGKLALRELSQFLRECKESTQYPGASMLPEYAITACSYRLTVEAVAILKRTAPGLYDWQEPKLPNDLCICRAGQPWLVTAAADAAASLYLEDEEAELLVGRIPGLRLTASHNQTLSYHD